MAELTSDIKRKYSIITAIAIGNMPTLLDISEITKIPGSSLKRQISQLRSDYDMDIRFIVDSNTKGRSGYYHISHWGVFDRTEFLVRFSNVLDQ
ncbi:helix-turn-helix domain-containing protein [Pelagibaculum spongiae]|uniref:Uncharacterized protein n=1 Tax=Pelagibaculum spongiae TaxID=2080658 RepID=A0A2V1GW63_9GAMM|nr:helix-turn-helix domain-containing protein [Pelagibaculum spongiae]PVZ64458.1 hypothetical protein DC094_19265 [Pelagibaculum spongiae]